MRITRYGLIPDSEGPGRHRGGLGLCREYVFVGHEPSYTILADRVRFPAWGLFGGRAGKTARYVLIGENGETDLPSKATVQLEKGQSVRLESCGGGGYGSPYERDPEQVLADVRQEKISPLRARDEYGVAVTGCEIDMAETERLRAWFKEPAITSVDGLASPEEASR